MSVIHGADEIPVSWSAALAAAGTPPSTGVRSSAPSAQPPDWTGFTEADAGVLVARVDDTAEAALQAFCRILIYARGLGRRFNLKPAWVEEYVSANAAAQQPMPIPDGLFDGGWLWTTMGNLFVWFNQNGRVPDGYRVSIQDGELVLERHPEEPFTADDAGLLVDDADGAEWAAVRIVRLADRLGWDGKGRRWELMSWRAEWEDPATWGNTAIDRLFDAAEDAVAWLNDEPGQAPPGYEYCFDGRDQLWLARSSEPEPRLDNTTRQPAPEALLARADGCGLAPLFSDLA